MTPERWKKIEDIFQAALDLPGEAREEFLTRECAGDAELRGEVEKFIARFETEDSFLESPVWTDSQILQSNIKREIAASLDEALTPANGETTSAIGERVGVYKLVKELGKGGMGVVYLGERVDGEFKQKVAIKLIKRGMDTDFIVRRFRQERQIAAALNHPNIARLLDGGTTKDDLPYFVMEYVEGKPFFKHSQTNNLGLRQKLELFLDVCWAIVYAHQKKIIHRDIKPGNILVSSDGEPKLLDFGIAKILDPDLIHDSQMPQTGTQMRLMTPEYASPEQIKGDEITEASDQYSLGVLLYELLTGTRPYKFPSRAPHEIARVICEEMPSGPSSSEFGKFITDGDADFNFDKDFCKKLDRIVLKALRKNPQERYASVKDFAHDIERFLEKGNVYAESFEGEKDDAELVETVLQQSVDSAISEQSSALLSPKSTNPDREKVTGVETHSPASNQIAKRRLPTALKYIFGSIALVIFILIGANVFKHTSFSFSSVSPSERWQTNFAALMNSRRLTTSGAAIVSAISPDGRQVAFSQRESDLQSIWIREIDSGEPRRIVAAAGAENFVGIVFSPNGKFVLYTVYDPTSANWSLNRVSTNGGEQQKILSDVVSRINFAPDGKSFVYFHLDAEAKTMSLLATESSADGTPSTNPPRKFAERTMPAYFTAHPAFSPDNRKIVFPVVSINGGKDVTNLFVVDSDTGREEKLGTTDFEFVTSVAWRENGEEIVLTGSRKSSEPLQLLLANYPSGEITRLSNDLSDYSGVSLTNDSRAFVTARKSFESIVSVLDLNAEKVDSEAANKQLTGGIGRQDGRRGVGWTADGRIIFVSRDDVETKVVAMDANGANKQSFNLGEAIPASPQMTADNRYLFFLDQREKESGVKRYELATGEIRQIHFGLSMAPVLTADSRFLLFSTVNDQFRTSLHSVPIEGGEPKELTTAACIRAAVSPDNRFVTCYYKPEQFSGKWELAVLNLSGGAPIRFINPPDTVSLMNPFERPTAWSKDSRSIYYINDKGGVSNIFRINADGTGAPEQITNFTAGRIFDFALSPDGNRVVLARGTTASDIVIFRNSN